MPETMVVDGKYPLPEEPVKETPAPEEKAKEPAPEPAPAPEKPQLTAAEQKASAQGWKPEAEWVASGGDPEKWRPATVWLDRGELLGQNKALKNKVDELSSAFVKMTEANRRAFIAGREQAIKELTNARKQAMREGDLERVVDLEEKAEAVKSELQQAIREPAKQPPKDEGHSPTYILWLGQNRWYLEDPLMHNYANAVIQKHMQANPDTSEQDAFDLMVRETKKVFPDKFPKERTAAEPPEPDSSGRRASVGNTERKNVNSEWDQLISEMDPLSAKIATNLVTSGNMSKATYLEKYRNSKG